MCRRDEDFHKFNERGKEAEIMKSQYRQMEIRLKSLERTQAEMDDNARSVGPLTFRHIEPTIILACIVEQSRH